MTYLQLVILYTATMIRRVVRSALGVRHLTVTTTVVVVIAVLLLRRVLFSPTGKCCLLYSAMRLALFFLCRFRFGGVNEGNDHGTHISSQCQCRK